MPPQDILEIAHLREVVADLGGALVKAAIAPREDGRPAEHAAIEALIPGIKAAVRDLDRLKEKLWRPAAQSRAQQKAVAGLHWRAISRTAGVNPRTMQHGSVPHAGSWPIASKTRSPS